MLNYLSALPGAVAQGLIWGLMGLGVFITYKVLDIADLTVDGTLCTGAAVFSVAMIAGVNPWISLILAILSGLAAGALTGVFHICLGIPAILAGILTQMIPWSVNLKILGKPNVSISFRTYPVLLSLSNPPRAILVGVLFAAGVIAMLYWFFGTELGASVRATGSNPVMCRAQGINTNMTKILGLSLSNGIVALSGALLCQYQGFTDINMGRGAVVTGLAAVVIGSAIVNKLSLNFAVKLAGVFFGAILYFLVYQTVIFIGLDSDLLKMLSALVVTVFLGTPYVKKELSKAGSIRKGGNSRA
ncbi:MAG: ABC transporter permease [Clostridia bacterium]|nr:ABC transporter permease [Clostridia bacterium]